MHFVKKFLLICTVLALSVRGFAQNSIYTLGLYNLSSISGELKGGGLYALLKTNSNGVIDNTKTANYYGGIFIKTSSYIWNPSFLTLDVDGGYYPESLQNQNLIFPNRYDVINTKRLHIGSVLFSGKPITLSGNFNISNSYDSRENLADIQTDSKTYGGGFAYKNKFLPVSFSINQTDWNSKEIQTGHTYYYKQNNIDARATKKFGKRDRNDLIFTHHDYWRQDYNLAATRNVSDNLELNNSYSLDTSGISRISSRIMGINQTGNDSFKQLSVNENLLYKLPHNLNFNCSYSFFDAVRPIQTIKQQSVNGFLSHQLYRSLTTSVSGEYSKVDASDYTQSTSNFGLNIVYNKILPFKGLLTLSYNYNLSRLNMQSQDVKLPVINEEYTFPDNDLLQLKRPYVDSASVVIKDATGTIIYQQYVDYYLVTVNGYIQIQRIPGGQIGKNGIVYLFYTANQPGSYKYDINLNNYAANVSLFKGLWSVYFNESQQSYSNIVNVMDLNLDYLTHYLYGSRIDYKVISLGAEFDDFRSSVYPYKMVRYFLNLHGYIGSNLVYSINANSRNNYQLPDGEPDRRYNDVNGMISYGLSRRSKLDVTLAYQNQKGKQINLDLATAKFKLTTSYRGLNFIFGVDMYDRNYLSTQKTDYIGGYFQVVKRF